MGSSVGLSSTMHHSGHGAAGGFVVGTHLGDGYQQVLVPLSAAVSPCLQGWHPQLRTVSLHIPPHGQSSGLQGDLAFASRGLYVQKKPPKSRHCVCHEVPRPLQPCSVQEL